MLQDISTFLGHFDQYNEAARADKFDVFIAPPLSLQSSFGARELSMQCETSELPGVDIVPAEYRHYGFTQRIPLHLQYAPINFTFYCNGMMAEKNLFDQWINLCIPTATGLITYRDDASGNKNYETTATIYQYDQTGKIIYFAQCEEAFPISVSPIITNWSDDSVHRLSITFVYKKWISGQGGQNQ